MNNTTSGKSNVPAIVVMFALFFMIAFVTNLAGSMGVIVTNQFGASKALSQLGTLANFIAYACMGIPVRLYWIFRCLCDRSIRRRFLDVYA